MTVLWCGCVLGLLCIPACQGVDNAVTVTQTPSSTKKINVNSSVNIMCSITGSNTSSNVLALSLRRRFSSVEEVIFVALKEHRQSIEIEMITTHPMYEGRVDTKLEASGETSLRILFTLSRLQVEDTDLFFCRWRYFGPGLKTFVSNGSIFIVERQRHLGCSGDVFLSDNLLIVLCGVSILGFFMLFLVLLVSRLCKHSHKKFTPRPRASVTQNRRQHIYPTPRNDNYYLSASVNSAFSQV